MLKQFKDVLKTEMEKESNYLFVRFMIALFCFAADLLIFILLAFFTNLIGNIFSGTQVPKDIQLIAFSILIYTVLKFNLKVNNNDKTLKNYIYKIVIETYAISYYFLDYIFKSLTTDNGHFFKSFALWFLAVSVIDRLHRAISD